MRNPFGTTFESFEGPAGPVVESVHQAAYQRLLDLIESEDGHLISLRAPRAGYGKTMLLARLKEKTKGRVTMVPVRLADGQRIEGEGILEECLTRLTENVPAMAGLTRLDLCTRRLFAQGLLPLVSSGEVPCQDQDGAVASLRERPTEAFDFQCRDATIAQWSKEQFEVLLPRLTSVLSKASGASSRDTSYWMDLLFNFAVRSPQETSRIGDLMNAVFGRESRFHAGAGFPGGLGAFLSLVTLVESVVLVLDEVDGLSGHADAALRATSSLVSLREACRRVGVVVSVNDDVWESAFAPGLPAGLRDRLEDVIIRLRPLTSEEARSLISARAGADSHKIIDELDLSLADLYPRGVLKAARDVWREREEHGPSGTGAAAATVPEDAAPTELFMPHKPAPDQVLVHQFRRQGTPEASHPSFSQPAHVEPSTSGFPLPEPQASSFCEAPAPASKFLYPPHPAKRVELPKAFEVHRLRSARPMAGFNEPTREDSGQRSSSNPPFDLSIAIEAMESSHDPFSQVPASGGDQVERTAAPVQKSPFEIVRPAPTPAPQPRQEASPQADADAIDELLRQFREHRDS